MTCLLPILLLLPFMPGAEPPADPARLREALHDRQDPRGQSQAALLLVRQRAPEAEAIVREGLKQTESPDVFLTLSSAVRLCRDDRFTEELLAALTAPAAGQRAPLRQDAAETLAVLADVRLVQRLGEVLESPKTDPAARQGVVWVLGRCGSKQAAAVLVGQLESGDEAARRAAVEALTALTGLDHGIDVARWHEWWRKNQDVPAERWLQQRLAYQGSRARRLEGELERSRAQVIRLHQQLYIRLPPAERLRHIQGVLEQEDAAVRQLAVNWCLELLSTLSARGGSTERDQHTVAELLLRLSHDSHPEIQRQAILALGRVSEKEAFERLGALLADKAARVRAVAARALAQQARGAGEETAARRKQVIPLLQKALDDSALEVVVEAAEGLGALGVPEAGPVLVCLLRHPAEHVRQTAVHALERVADASVLDGLLAALDDPAAVVRFSLVGAVSQAARDVRSLSDGQRGRLEKRLVKVLTRDPDPGVRSRAATVLGECGRVSVLPHLWQRVIAVEDSRVQDKAWAALVAVLTRSGDVALLREWDALLTREKHPARRLHLLAEAHARWQKRDDARALFVPVTELLVAARLEQGKWPAAVPLLRELLSRADNDASRERTLRWALTAGEQAVNDGQGDAALRLARELRPHLPAGGKFTSDFDRLEKQARAKD